MIVALIGLVLSFVMLMAAMYAVPIHRTWKKEHDEPLTMPGPQLQPGERLGA